MADKDYKIGKEIKRITNNNKGEWPKGPKILLKAHKVKEPQKVLDKAKEVMLAVSQYAYTNQWPSDEEWKTILPEWFVKSMTDKSDEDLDNDDDQWHYESWVDNIRQRSWVWWSSKIEKDTITIVLDVLDMPYLHDSLKYVFYAQRIPMSNITDEDDIYDKS